MSRWRSPALGLIGLMLLSDLALMLPGLRYGGAFLLLWVLPGLAWGLHLSSGRRPSAEEWAVGMGLGFGTTWLLTLLLSYLPGPFPGWLLAVGLHLLVVSVVLPQRRREGAEISERFSLSLCALCVSVVCLSSLFRFVNLGYSEFQGDEAVIMVRAAAVLAGDPDQLFLHQKGPLEILTPIATWSLNGTINEWQARLPFAAAGVVGVLAATLLGARLLNRRAGLVGGLILAINGYFVGFGRIVQYQSLVLMTVGLGLLAVWLWQERGEDRWLLAGGGLLACGLLAHYDAALALPAALYLIIRGLNRRDAENAEKSQFFYLLRLRGGILPVVCAAAVGAAVLALFYVPYALHPNFAKTLAYLRTERVGTGGPVYNNLLSTLPLTILYNSTCYVILLVLLLVAAGFRPFRRWGLAVPALCLTALALATWAGANANVGALAAAGIWLAAIVASPRTSPGERALWLWFGTPFLLHYFLVWDPRTHVLNAFPAASLLAATTLAPLAPSTPLRSAQDAPEGERWGKGIRAIALLALYVFLGYYTWMVFVDHTPEYRRTWPEHRSPIYWTPYDELPRFGLFGFPYRAGWKTVGALIAEGELEGVYASNEEEEITRWYTRGAERTYCPGPDLYLIAARVQDEMPVDRADLEANYDLAAEIRVAGEPKLWLYRPGSLTTEPVVYDAGDFEALFDQGMTLETVLPRPPTGIIPVGVVLGGQVRLAGYRLDASDARPGGSLRLTLYWEALEPMRTSYQVFTHLYDGAMWGQHDSAPGCGLWPTTRWEPGRWVRDDHLLSIAADAPGGAIPLLVGMYNLGTGVRLAAVGPDGEPLGDAVLLTEVELR